MVLKTNMLTSEGFAYVDRVAALGSAGFEVNSGLITGLGPNTIRCYGAIDG